MGFGGRSSEAGAGRARSPGQTRRGRGAAKLGGLARRRPYRLWARRSGADQGAAAPWREDRPATAGPAVGGERLKPSGLALRQTYRLWARSSG